MRFSATIKRKKAIAALPMILLISGIIIEIVIALSLVSFFMVQSGAGAKTSSDALMVAQSGIDSGISTIIRNKDTGDSSKGGATSAALVIDSNHSAQIYFCKDYYISTSSMACDVGQPNSGQTEIISTGKAFAKNRRLQAFISVDSMTGEVRLVSTQEIAL